MNRCPSSQNCICNTWSSFTAQTSTFRSSVYGGLIASLSFAMPRGRSLDLYLNSRCSQASTCISTGAALWACAFISTDATLRAGTSISVGAARRECLHLFGHSSPGRRRSLCGCYSLSLRPYSSCSPRRRLHLCKCNFLSKHSQSNIRRSPGGCSLQVDVALLKTYSYLLNAYRKCLLTTSRVKKHAPDRERKAKSCIL